MRTLNDRREIDWMLRGLGVLGTGGGGDPRAWGTSLINADVARGRAYQLADPSEVEDDALVVSGGYLGSVAEDRSLDRVIDAWDESFELEGALREMETLLGRKIGYLVPFEMGGGNTPVILSAGARLGIPVIDGDALGRAAPETHMTSFIGQGISLTPMPLVDANGTVVVVKSTDTIFCPDEIGRFLVSSRPGLMANAHYPMTGVQLKGSVVPNTISESIAWGRFLDALDGTPEEKLSKLCDRLGAFPLLWGRVKGMKGENRGGFYHARAALEGLGTFTGQTVELTIKNEFMLARRNGEPVTVFPDLVLMIDPENNEGVLTPDIEAGREVILLARPCHDRLRRTVKTEIGALAFASQRYDEDVTFEPVERLMGQRR
jgi:uncharacterized protein